ncbi:MAG: biotin/lipoyl-containing protein, partial [Chloroflexota bacterium]
MIRPIIMPKLGETVEEAKIVRWLKREGDWVEKGEPLLVVETDKVSMDVESPASGYLRQRLYAEGKTVAVTLSIAYLADSMGETLLGEGVLPPSFDGQTPFEMVEPPERGVQMSQRTFTADRPRTPGALPQATPLARRLARERGIDLSSITGSGLGGRITERDILAATRQGVGTSGDEPRQPAPLSTMRRRIAERMVASKATVPHFYLSTRIDMSKIVALRSRLQREGQTAPSYQALVIKATAQA